METKKFYLRFGILTLLILSAAFSRIIPHYPNFTPLCSICLFGAAYFGKKWQILIIPIMATWLSDLLINNLFYREYYSAFTWFTNSFYWQYSSYVLISMAGMYILKNVSIKNILIGAIGSSMIFFLITNFGSFVYNSVYPKTLTGLAASYIAGLPFLAGTIAGTLFYSGLLFGSFELLKQWIPALNISSRSSDMTKSVN